MSPFLGCFQADSALRGSPPGSLLLPGGFWGDNVTLGVTGMGSRGRGDGPGGGGDLEWV